MSAHIIIFPVIRIERAPVIISDDIEVKLDPAVYEKLAFAAEKANSSIELMAATLIVYGLAAIEKKTAENFLADIDYSRPRGGA